MSTRKMILKIVCCLMLCSGFCSFSVSAEDTGIIKSYLSIYNVESDPLIIKATIEEELYTAGFTNVSVVIDNKDSSTSNGVVYQQNVAGKRSLDTAIQIKIHSSISYTGTTLTEGSITLSSNPQTLTISGTGSVTGSALTRYKGLVGYQNYYSLKELVIEEGVTALEAELFKNTAFEYVDMPSSLTEIGSGAFENCTSLKKIYLPSTVTAVGSEVFKNATDCTVTTDCLSTPSGWAVNWNEDAQVEYGKTKGQFLRTVTLSVSELGANAVIEVDGQKCSVTETAGNKVIEVPEGAKTLVVYNFNSATGDPHTIYPTGFKVYFLKTDALGRVSAVYQNTLDNALQYAGTSIRITGNKGIRIISGISTPLKNTLINTGIDGYKLVEYGTLACWASSLPSGLQPVVNLDLTTGKKVTKGYAYSLANHSDSVYKYSSTLTQYTNTIVGQYTGEQCASDFAMRSYMILRNSANEEIIIYGGSVYRSIGYIAYANRNAFKPGTDAYEYIWSILYSAYQDLYKNEYQGSVLWKES